MNVSLTNFIKADLNDALLNNQIICFCAKEYSPLFFSLMIKEIKPTDKNINLININDFDVDALKLQFEQSFLGNSLFYWLGNISEYKNKKELISYLNLYKGDHLIAFFVDENIDNSFNRFIVNCDNFVTLDSFRSLLILWPQSKQITIERFLRKIFEKNSKLSFDQFCIFVNYSILLGSRNSNFIDQWLDKIIVNEHSFFTLSKYFFAFDSNSFYKYWNLLSNDYSPIFWTTYWSDQLFRAFNFLYLKNQNKNLQAKQIAYKLPFSFIQTDWRKTSLNELSNANQFIYNLDYNLKNGASDFSLDLFYAKFLAKEFK